ncbi:MAG: heavy metal translocating P-type ATPase [Planctomycetota bacterium]
MGTASLPADVDHEVTLGAAAREADRRMRWPFLRVLLGATLLVCSILAGSMWPKPLHAALPSAAATVILGLPLIWAAGRDLAAGRAGMNALVSLAVVGAAAMGRYQESAAVALFMTLSALLEKRTAIGAEASIRSLLRLSPTKAQRLIATPARDAPPEETVEAQALRPGDLVRVRPGETIPADGVITVGTSSVDQSSVTGESLPADKAVGEDVFGGTINLTGVIDVKVTKAGPDTLLGRVSELILQAERTRPPIVRLIDQYAAWYTPTVLMLVGVVLFFALRSDPDTAFSRAIAMLVVACPSALVLATPTAMVAGLSAAARLGVLVKSVATLEAARNLTAIVFDKTGTLTSGVLSVTKLAPAEGVEPADLLGLAAAATQDSRHPVARAVTEMAQRARLPLERPTAFEEVAGRGLAATVGGHQIRVGRASWLGAPAAGLDEAAREAIAVIQASPEADGLSVLYVIRDRQLVGWIGLEDNARPGAAEAVDRLRGMGIQRLVILTGDRESVARRVAAQMHVGEFRAEVLPHEKLEMVDGLKARGYKVAVIGDGVNDAPALAAGDVSIAMGAAGSDVAIHSASIALLNSNLDRVPFLLDLSRRTIRVIRQNLVVGAAFIVVFLALAAAGYLPPVAAAFLHIASGLLVVFNSARLVRCGEDVERAELPVSRRPGTETAPPPG